MPHRWGISHHPHAKILDNGLRLWLLSSITKWWLGRDGDAFWEREKEKWGGVEDGSNEIKLWSLRWNRGIRNFEKKKNSKKKKKENSKKKNPFASGTLHCGSIHYSATYCPLGSRLQVCVFAPFFIFTAPLALFMFHE